MRFKYIILLVLLISCLGAASELPVEELFSQALHEKGKAYLDIRNKILAVGVDDDSFLRELSQNSDCQTRLLAQALLERLTEPQKCQHFEELMIVPIAQVTSLKAQMMMGASPFESIKLLTQTPRGRNYVRRLEMFRSSEATFKNFCHDESAFAFLAEIALKDTMLELPELSEQIEWSDKEKIYTVNEVAVMLDVLPQTAGKWHLAGLFCPRRISHFDSSALIGLPQIKAFYQLYSDKIIKPEYFRSKGSVLQVIHSGMSLFSARFEKSPGSLFRCYAVLMIGSFSRPEVPEVLYEVFKADASDYVRAYCVEGFSAETQVPQIRHAMKDASLRVRQAAVVKSRENLDAFDVSDYLPLISRDDNAMDSLDKEIVRTLGQKGDTAAIEPLIEIFALNNAQDFPHEPKITQALIAIDPNSVYHALEHHNQKIRLKAWKDLASFNANFPVKKEYLFKYIDRFEGDSYIIPQAIRVIAKNDHESLAWFLQSENPLVKIEAMKLLGYPGKYFKKEDAPHLKDIVLSCLDDSDRAVHRAAMKTLSQYRFDKDVSLMFMEALNDPHPGCRKIAVENLSGPDIVSAIDTLLMRETDRNVHLAAFHALAESKDPSRKRVLLKYVHDKDMAVRSVVARALGKFKDEQTIEALKVLLTDTESYVRSTAIKSIAEIDLELLSEIIPHVQPELRKSAYNFLARSTSDTAVTLLIEGTRDKNHDVRLAALLILSELKESFESDDPAVCAVIICLQDDNLIARSFAIHALYIMLEDKSLEHIARCLHDSEKRVRGMAVGHLSRSKSAMAVKYLVDALAKEDDKNMIVDMVRALEEITGNLLTKDEWMLWWKDNEKTYLEMQR